MEETAPKTYREAHKVKGIKAPTIPERNRSAEVI